MAEQDAWLRELRSAVTFYTRVPRGWLEPARDEEADPAAPASPARMAPLAGLLVGIVGAAVFVLSMALTGASAVSAILAVAATLLFTGALHEDGLADFADALGGDTAEKRLKIMADSSNGAFGAAAIVLSILARVALISALADIGGTLPAALALVAAHSTGRAAALWVPYALPPARKSGTGFSFGRPNESVLIQAVLIAAVIAFVLAASATGIVATAVALIFCGAAAFVMALASDALIGGQTGDVSGAAEQVCEIAFLFGLLAAAAW